MPPLHTLNPWLVFFVTIAYPGYFYYAETLHMTLKNEVMCIVSEGFCSMVAQGFANQ
jgi:hypothetical protein